MKKILVANWQLKKVLKPASLFSLTNVFLYSTFDKTYMWSVVYDTVEAEEARKWICTIQLSSFSPTSL